MDLKAVLTEVGTWPAEERLRLVQEVWQTLREEEFDPELDPDLKALFDSRLESLERNSDDVIPWQTVEARLIERWGR